MFKAATAEQKPVLSKYFTVKRTGIMGKVTSFEDACKILGESPKNKTPYEKLCIIIKALNDGWWPNFNDGNEYKYWNYFYMIKGAFTYNTSHCDNTHMYVPSALYFKTRELAEYAAEIALDEYKEFYLAKP